MQYIYTPAQNIQNFETHCNHALIKSHYRLCTNNLLTNVTNQFVLIIIQLISDHNWFLHHLLVYIRQMFIIYSTNFSVTISQQHALLLNQNSSFTTATIHQVFYLTCLSKRNSEYNTHFLLRRLCNYFPEKKNLLTWNN